MKQLLRSILLLLCLQGLYVPQSDASHGMGADLSYRCLGGNSYEITVSFYRDCEGVPANNYIYVHYSSASCGIHDSIRVDTLPDTGKEITEVCVGETTTCQGGNHVGIQEWVYRDTIQFPQACTDWKLSYTQCCRNGAITTISSPTNDSLYIFAMLNNSTVTCNSSPTFSNKPVPFACVNQHFCFSHMASDADGDSLAYSLITPYHSATGRVQYLAGFDSANALSSSPVITFNPLTGEICMDPTSMQVTVMAVLVREYRNGVLIGSVERDIQITVTVCSNILPTASGINGTNSRADTLCANVPYCFTIGTTDPDVSQNTTLSWDSTITGASFTVNPAYRSSATFCWTPSSSDIRSAPHCFSVIARDNNCPMNGMQMYSFCLTVEGVQVVCPDVTAPCNANAQLVANASGGTGPFTYSWNTGQSGNTITSSPGQYIVTASDGTCQAVDTARILPGSGVPVAAFTSATSCAAPLVDFTDGSVPSGSTTITNWLWDFGDGNTGSGPTPSHTYASPGTYPVQLIVQTSSGCSDTILINVAAGGPSPVSAFGAASVCRGLPAQFLDSSSATAGSLVTWKWDFGDGNSSTASNPSHLYSASGNYSVSLIVCNTAGCYDTLTKNYTVHPDPVISAGNDTSICRLASLVLTASGGASYVWTPLGSATASITVSPMINTVYTVTGTDSNGCIATDNVAVGVNSLPTANAGTPVSICLNSGTTLQAAGGGSYLWQPGAHAGSGYPVAPAVTTVYTVVVTTPAGCSDTDEVTVTVNPNPVAYAGPDTSVCAGSSTGLSGTGGGSYQWTPGSSGSANVQVSPVATTLYTLVVANAFGCRDTDWVNVQVNSTPVAYAGLDDSICLTDSVTLTASGGGGYSWSPISSSSPIVQVSPLSSTVYTLTVTAANGCTDTDQVRITVNPLPVANAGNDAAICSNDSVTLTATGGTGYSWNPSGDTSAALLVRPALTTDYIVEVTNSNGCKDQDTVRVTVNPNPVAIAGNDTSICLNDSVVLQASGATHFAWSSGDTTSSISVSPSATVDYFVLVTDQNGCQDSDTIQVVVHPLPVAMAGPDTTICFNQLATLSASGGSGYSWTPGNAQTSIYPVSPAATTNYIVTVTDSNMCISWDTVRVNVNPLPVAWARPDTSLCEGDSVLLSSSGGGSYAWYPGNLMMQALMVSPPSTTLFTVVVTDANGCKDSADVQVRVNPRPSAIFILSPSVCEGEDLGLQNQSTVSSGNLQHAWDFGNGFQSNLIQPSYSYNVPGTYTVSLVVVSDSGCADPASAVVTVRPNPVAAFSVDNICALETALFNNQSQSVTAPIQYSWTLGNGLTDTAFNPAATYTQSGNYIVKLVVSATGCSDSTVHTLHVHPLPEIHFSGPVVCQGTPTTFANQSTVSSGSISTWSWNFGDTTGSSLPQPIHTFLHAGNFRVSLIAVSTAGCTDTGDVVLRVNPRPSPSFDVENTCQGTAAQFTDLSAIGEGSLVQWLWIFGDGTISTQQNPTKIYPSHGSYPVQLTVTSDSGCSATITQPAGIEVYPLPEPAFTASPTKVLDLFPKVEFTNLTPGNNFYLWDFGDGSGSEDYSPSHDYTSVGYFRVLLVVTSLQGCIDSTWSRVEVEQSAAIYLPNSFTPNADGDNDVYRPVFYNQTSIRAEIFDRWGELIYKWDGLEGGWDGTTQGQPAPIAVYVCRLVAVDINGKTKSFLSNVSLIR